MEEGEQRFPFMEHLITSGDISDFHNYWSVVEKGGGEGLLLTSNKVRAGETDSAQLSPIARCY